MEQLRTDREKFADELDEWDVDIKALSSLGGGDNPMADVEPNAATVRRARMLALPSTPLHSTLHFPPLSLPSNFCLSSLTCIPSPVSFIPTILLLHRHSSLHPSRPPRTPLPTFAGDGAAEEA